MKYRSGNSLASALAFTMAPSVPFAASVSVTVAPNAWIMWRRSIETASLITISTGYPFAAPIIASPMPVFPLVGSMMVLPGRSAPSRSACSIILSAIRSLMLPVGLNPSSFANIRTRGFGLRRLIRTTGVRPMRSRIVFA